MENLILEFDAFVRSFKQNKDSACAFLLGAGASISSDIQSASDCIWEWKKEIYCSSNPDAARLFQNYKSDSVKKRIQGWLDIQGGYPQLDSNEEYSFYAEKTYPLDGDRAKYFFNLVNNKAPYVGYKLLALLNKYGIVRSVWTTNFDGLIERAAHQLNITPIAVNLDNSDRIYRNDTISELLYIALHGDYKYTRLKNTSKELDSQDQVFKDVLKRYFIDKNLVVCGYSGRDKSLMNALTEAFSEKGSGRIYWCGFGNNIPKEVEELIFAARKAGRDAYYIPTDGFDKTIISLTITCVEGNTDRVAEVETEMANVPLDNATTPFEVKYQQVDKYLKSNLFPVILPQEVFQFEVEYKKNETAWNTIRKLTNGNDISAVPFKSKVFAISTLSKIREVFGSRINGKINLVPVSINDIECVGAFRELFLSAIIKGISGIRGLHTDNKYRLWKTLRHSVLNNVNIFEAIDCSLVFSENKDYLYLSIKPTIHLESNSEISKEIKLQASKRITDPLRNSLYDAKIVEWESIIFGNNNLKFEFPISSGSDFTFKIGKNRGFATLSTHSGANIRSDHPSNFNSNSVISRGIQMNEPVLEFLNANNNSAYLDYHPMRALSQHKPYDYEYNRVVFSEDVKLGVVCPQAHSTSLYSFLQGFNTRISASANSDYMVDFLGFQRIYGIPLYIPNVGSEKWVNIDNSYGSSQELAKLICHKINSISDSHNGLVLVIFIPRSWESLKRSVNNGEVFDLHDYIKAYAAKKKITTQFIEDSTLQDPMRLEVYWWLSLAFYVKSLRTPWVLSNLDNKTAYAGIGYSVKKDKNGKVKVVLGCSHIFNSKGEGLKYKLSKIDNPILDKKNNPFLTYDEAFKFGVSVRELFMQSMNTLPGRVVIHKRTPFKEDEMNGIRDALGKAGIRDIDMVEINYERDIRYMAQNFYNGVLSADGYPIYRGTCIVKSKNEALLWTHGVVPSVINQKRKYYMGGNSIPEALKITKHYGKGDLQTIAAEILGFTKMNWNSFNLYTKLPATIDTSNTLARIGTLLSMHEGETYDYRYFI